MKSVSTIIRALMGGFGYDDNVVSSYPCNCPSSPPRTFNPIDKLSMTFETGVSMRSSSTETFASRGSL